MGRGLILLLSVFFAVFFCSGGLKLYAEWIQLSCPFDKVESIGVGKDFVFVAADRYIYKLNNGVWEKVARIRGDRDVKVHDICEWMGEIFWATSIGLFSKAHNTTARRIFLPRNKVVWTVEKSASGLFCGTDMGVYRYGSDSSWEHILPAGAVLDLRCVDGYSWLIVVGRDWAVVWDLEEREVIAGDVKNTSVYVEENGVVPFSSKRIVFDGRDVYVFFSNAVWRFSSLDKSFEQVFQYPGEGMGIVSLGNDVLCFGNKGFYLVAKNEKQFNDGLISLFIDFADGSGDRLYAVVEGKLYVFSPQDIVLEHLGSCEFLWEVLSWEPSVELLQDKAMRFADVHPEKILRWKELIKKRAFLPKVSFGVDVDNNRTISDSIAVASSGAENVGPDDKTVYKALNVGVSFEWNLGDIIWNPDEISIDMRSKLTVELRDDILDQVNQLFFERRRKQMSLVLSPPKKKSKLLELLFKIEKLQAELDALTGGFLSSYLRANGHIGWEREFVKKLLEEREG